MCIVHSPLRDATTPYTKRYVQLTNESNNNCNNVSFKPVLLNREQKRHEFLYWEFPSYKGQQAVRIGKWKGIRKNIFDGNLAIELYNLETDIEEKNDVSIQYPEIIRKMEKIMKEEHESSINEKFKFKQLGDM